jgi:HEAT repeat protein
MSSAQPRLVAILKDPGAETFAKAKACQRLAVVGDAAAVPALAALLDDEKLSLYARFGLEQISGSAADKALRDALGRLEGDRLIGVINSVGRRRDPLALDALAKLRHDSDRDVAAAAEAALGRLRRP